MPTTYISNHRLNYNGFSESCLYSEIFSRNCYFCQKAQRWLKCSSDYCNVHGLQNRRLKADRLTSEAKANGLIGLWYGVTIYFGKYQDLEQQQLVFEEWKRLVKKTCPEISLLKVNHWKNGRRHFHIILGFEYLIKKPGLRRALTQAAKARGMNPAKLRLCLKARHVINPFIKYALRTKGKLETNEFPPAKARWEMVRL